MKLFFKMILFFICTTQAISQTFKEDSIAVEAILDSNDSGIDIDNVIGVENGRVVILFLKSSMAVDIHVIPADIGKLTALKKLILLDFWALETLPPEIGNLKALDSLVITGCGLKELPDEIGNCSALLYIYCSDNRELVSLPSHIGNLKNLRELDVSFNNLTEIPAEIVGLTSLISFNASSNKLTELPIQIGNLTSLIRLDVCFNNLITLPVSIGNISTLLKLYIHCNNISSIPIEICTITNLQFFHADRNKLLSIPSDFGNLTQLKKAELSNNMLTSLPPSITKINLPQGDSGINLCFNPDLVFTPEQQTWAGAKDYAEYEDKYCDVAIEEFAEKESKSAINTIAVLPGTILFQVLFSGQTTLEVYDILGKKVTTLFKGYKNGVNYSVSWEAERAGVYLIKLTSGKTTQIKKVTVTR